MRFEKWQALGNDYLIVTEPVDAETVRALCNRHTGVGADGVRVLNAAREVRELHGARRRRRGELAQPRELATGVLLRP